MYLKPPFPLRNLIQKCLLVNEEHTSHERDIDSSDYRHLRRTHFSELEMPYSGQERNPPLPITSLSGRKGPDADDIVPEQPIIHDSRKIGNDLKADTTMDPLQWLPDIATMTFGGFCNLLGDIDPSHISNIIVIQMENQMEE